MNHSETSRRSWWLRAAGIIVLTVSMVFGSGAAVASSVASSTSQSDSESSISIPDLVEKVRPSVVTVYAVSEDSPGISIGTGFVYDDEGHIVTNWHVVYGMDQFAVALSDGTQITRGVELVGQDPYDDVAVIKINPSDAPDPLPIGDETKLRLGDPVVAIGTPGGFLPGSVSSGIVSGLDRDQLANTENPCQVYANMIQHDAAISQGNSGGPLFNMDGEVIGINTVGLPVNEGGVPNQNLNFAVPASRVEKVANDMIENGLPSIAIMGVQTRSVLPGDGEFDQENIFQNGEEVTRAQSNGPADEAGLEKGDIITKIDGKVFTIESGMTSQIAALNPGDEIEVTYWRDGEEDTTMLTLGEASEASLDRCTLEQEDSGE